MKKKFFKKKARMIIPYLSNGKMKLLVDFLKFLFVFENIFKNVTVQMY